MFIFLMMLISIKKPEVNKPSPEQILGFSESEDFVLFQAFYVKGFKSDLYLYDKDAETFSLIEIEGIDHFPLLLMANCPKEEAFLILGWDGKKKGQIWLFDPRSRTVHQDHLNSFHGWTKENDVIYMMSEGDRIFLAYFQPDLGFCMSQLKITERTVFPILKFGHTERSKNEIDFLYKNRQFRFHHVTGLISEVKGSTLSTIVEPLIASLDKQPGDDWGVLSYLFSVNGRISMFYDIVTRDENGPKTRDRKVLSLDLEKNRGELSDIMILGKHKGKSLCFNIKTHEIYLTSDI